jgi:hypothetical protein
VPHYDFNWQNSYKFAEPKLMPKGKELHCVAHFDNSEENLANPDPTDSVRWGDQTWEEMMIGYFDMVITEQDLTQQTVVRRTDEFLANAEKNPPQLNDELTKLIQEAVTSDEKMTQLLLELRKIAPQLDRMGVTIVQDDGQVHIARVAQEFRLGKIVGGAGATLPARLWSLPRYAKGKETVVHDNIAKLRSAEFRFMSSALGASMHVPATFDGKPATVNFWSAENDAFPPQAVALFEEVAKVADAVE